MQEKELLEQIERLNKEYDEVLNSKVYRTGEKVLKLKGFLKKLDFKSIIQKNRKNKKIRKLEKYQKTNRIEPKQFLDLEEIKDKKIAIYTCIVGNYDNVLEPVYKNDNIDYYLFTDNKNIKSDKWLIKDISEEIKDLKNNTTINRYIKFHPHELFEEYYDYSIYIDGNIEVLTDITEFICNVNPKTGLAMHSHEKRSCIYQEKEICKVLKKGNPQKIDEQLQRYRKEGFPENFGMLEANMIITDLKNSKSQDILNSWWQEFISSQSNRDQLALPYILWKNNLKIDDIGIIAENIYKNYKIRVIREHK